MARRVIDQVVLKALDEHGNDKLKEDIFEVYGEGTLVPEVKSNKIPFGKTPLGMPTRSLYTTVKNTTLKLLSPAERSMQIVTYDGQDVIVNSNIGNIIKALYIYRLDAPPELELCLTKLFGEISDLLSNRISNMIYVKVDSDDSQTPEFPYPKLYEEVRKEAFQLLREAGLSNAE